MKFLIGFCKPRHAVALVLSNLVVLVLDLFSFGIILAFIKLLPDKEVIESSAFVNKIYVAVGTQSYEQFLMWLGICGIIFFILKFAAKTAINRFNFGTINGIAHRLIHESYRNFFGARYAVCTEMNPSEIVGIINTHSWRSIICFESLVGMINESLFLIVLLASFMYYNPVVTFILICLFAIVGIVIYFQVVRRIIYFGQVHSRLAISMHRLAYALVSSIKDIKIMRLEEQNLDKISSIWESYCANDTKSKTVHKIPSDLSEMMIFAGVIGTCLFLIVSKTDAVQIITIISLLAVSSVRVLPSFNKLLANYNGYKFNKASLEETRKLYEALSQNQQDIRHVNIPFNRQIDARNISFSYGEKKVLDGLSFTIPKGGSIAFVGTSGAGKSTLLDLLVGIRESEHASFYIDGIEFDPYRSDALRNYVGYVPQNVTVIDESIAFNISFSEQYDKMKMADIIRLVRLEQFVAEQPEGLDTKLGENGARISGGQRQRIGIARALYRASEVLILDEATSSLDNITEREILKDIGQLPGFKTIIMVAHRLTTVEKCDTIYFLEHGRIIAQGSHMDLLGSCAQYRDLYYQVPRQETQSIGGVSA